MRISSDVESIASSLSFLGLETMADRMESDIRQTASTGNTTGIIASSFSMYACEVKATRAAKCLKRSRLPEMIANTSMGEALRGRILERAKVVSITGPDLRLLDMPLHSDEG